MSCQVQSQVGRVGSTSSERGVQYDTQDSLASESQDFLIYSTSSRVSSYTPPPLPPPQEKTHIYPHTHTHMYKVGFPYSWLAEMKDVTSQLLLVNITMNFQLPPIFHGRWATVLFFKQDHSERTLHRSTEANDLFTKTLYLGFHQTLQDIRDH